MLKEQFPEESHRDLIKRMSDEWKKLEGESKAKYEKLCSEDKERYLKERIIYKEKVKA